jgi:hypothetical protein
MKINGQLVAAAALTALRAHKAAAQSVNFVNQDGIERSVVFTPAAGQAGIPSLRVPGYQSVRQPFPGGWEGNWFATPAGAPPVPGMLGEVRFDGYGDTTYFDVSAIVNPTDTSNVKQLFPSAAKQPVSGCQAFPCDTVYKRPDDLQTLTTPEKDLTCLLGNPQVKRSVSKG